MGVEQVQNPTTMTMMIKDKLTSVVQTYDGVAMFDWGVTWTGKEITLKWDYMTLAQWDFLVTNVITVTTTIEFQPNDGQTDSYGDPLLFNAFVKSLKGDYHLTNEITGALVYRKDVELVLVIHSHQNTYF
jgi:hypothetical protein